MALRVKVEVGESRRLVAVPTDVKTVDELTIHLAKTFAVAKLLDLSTADGFLLDKADLVSAVVRDGDVLTGKDFGLWLESNKQYAGQDWLRAEQQDFESDDIYWACVSYNTERKTLALQTGVNREVKDLQFFTADQLRNFAKPGLRVISTRGLGSKEGKDGKWFTAASFIVNDDESVGKVELAVRSSTGRGCTVRHISISLPDTTDGDILKGETTEISSERPTYDLSHKVTDSKVLFEGPSFDPAEENEIDYRADPPKAVVEENTLGIEVENRALTEIEYRGKRGDVMASATFYNTFRFIPGSDLIVRKVTAEYCDSKGNWVAAGKVYSGDRRGIYNYSGGYEPLESCHLEWMRSKPVDVAFWTNITFEDPASEGAWNVRRIPNCLPSPLRVRWTIHGKQGGRTVIVGTADNKDFPLGLPTESKQMPSDRKKITWLQADDLTSNERIWIAVSSDYSDRWGTSYEFRTSSRSQTFYADELDKMAYKAIKEGKTEIDFSEDIYTSENGKDITAKLLVDEAHRVSYAVSVQLKTSTSSASQVILLPHPNSEAVEH